MGRTPVFAILISIVAASASFAAPSHAATPAAAVPDAMFIWGYDNITVRPASGLVHLDTPSFTSNSNLSKVTAAASDGTGSYMIAIGDSHGPALTTGTSELPVWVTGDGANCLGTAWVAIDDIAFDTNDHPTRLAIHLTVPCDDGHGGHFSASAMINTTVDEPAHDITPVALLYGTVYKAPAFGTLVTIRNPSTAPLPVQSIAVSTTAFAMSDDHCTGVTLPPGGSCTLRVRPHPNGPLGEHTAQLQIADGMSTVAGNGLAYVSLEANYAASPGTPFATDTNPPSMPANTEPIVGDFDGNGSDDIFFYGKADINDVLWTTDEARTWSVTFERVRGDYQPFAGDFDGDGRTDMFWYAPGSASDSIWFDVVDHAEVRTLSVNGNYRPLLGDYNGDGIDDILWYAPGAAADSVWYGRHDRTFTSRPVTIAGDYQYVTGGDFNGDGRTDLVFWNPGTTQHPLWLSQAGGGFIASHLNGPAAGAVPLTVYADYDNKTDVLWYGAGSIPDALDLSSVGTRQPLSISGDYEVMWGNFNGDNYYLTDIVWWAATTHANADPMWIGNGHGFDRASTSTLHVDWNRYFSLLGNFLAGPVYGYGQPDSADIVYAPLTFGDPTVIWWSHDVDGTSNPSPWAARTHAPQAPAARRPVALRGSGRCNASAPPELHLLCAGS